MIACLFPYSFRRILVFFVLFLALCPAVWVEAAGFGTDVNYQEAVPAFLEAITEAVATVLTEEELQDVASWNEANKERIEEFLNDLVDIAILLEDNADSGFVFTQYQVFIDKWNEVAATYPHYEKVEPVLTPLVNELFAGLPELDPVTSSANNPMAPLAEHFQETEAANPWGLGAFWRFRLPEDEPRVTTIEEFKRETTTAGVLKVQTIQRKVVTTKNGTVVFKEITQNDELIERIVEYGNPTLVHDILEQLKGDGQDMDLISSFEKLVQLINDNLQLALDNNVTDECSYDYIYRKESVGTEETCKDIINNDQDVLEMNEFDPFDQVNQVFLGFNDDESSMPPLTGLASSQEPRLSRPQTLHTNDIRQARYQQKDRLRQIKDQMRRLKSRQKDLQRFFD